MLKFISKQLSFSFCLLMGLLYSISADANPIDSAYIYLNQGQLQKAESFLTPFFQSPDSIERNERTSDYFSLKGNIENEKGSLNLSLFYHQKAHSIRKELFGDYHNKVAGSLSNVGKVLLAMGQLEKANQYFLASHAIHKKLKTTMKAGVFPLRSSMVKLAILKNDFEEAKRLINELEQIIITEQLSSQVQLNGLYNLKADYFSSIGAVDSAAVYLGLILEQINQSNGKGNLLYLIYQHKYALFLFKSYKWQEAQELVLDVIRKVETETYGDHLLKGKCFQLLGLISLNTGDYSSAVTQFNIALQNLPASLPEIFEIKLGLANAKKAIGQYDEALEILNEVQSTLLSRSTGFLNLSGIKQWLFLTMGDCYAEQSLWEPAIYFYNEALAVDCSTCPKQNNQVVINGKLTEVFIGQSNFVEAAFYLKKVESQIDNTLSGQLYLSFLKARLFQEKGENEAAKKLFNEIINRIQETGNLLFPYEQVQAYSFLSELLAEEARLQQDPKLWKEVLETSKAGIEVVDQLYGVFQSPGNFIDLKSRFSILYDMAVTACYHLDHQSVDRINEGLIISDLLRVNRLSNLMRQQAYFENTGYPEAIVMQKSLLAQKARLQQEHYLASLDGLPIPSPNEKALEKQLSFVQEALMLSAVSGKNKPQNQQELDLDQIQGNLEDNESLLQFHWAKDQLFLFYVNKDQTKFNQYPTTEGLADSLQVFFELTSINPQTIDFEAYRAYAFRYVGLSNWIYRFLFAGLDLPKGDQLIIVPDGLLHYLPFASLIVQPDNDPERFKLHNYLVNDYPMVTVSSFQDYLLSKSFPERNNRELVCIAPDFTKAGSKYGSLDFNQIEARSVASITGGTAFLEKGISKGEFEKKQTSGFWHFSTHAILNDRNPGYSYLVMATNEGETGALLFFNDLEQYDLKAEMVTLSACQTGAGKLWRGEGIQSMAKAFLMCGVPSVVASLWNVNDATTPEIMGNFYEALHQGQKKGEALQTAQLKYLENANHYLAHPYFWAGFQIHNNDRSVNFKKGFNWQIVLWGGVILLLSLGWFLWNKQRHINRNSSS